MEKENNTDRITALEKRMTDSENRERLESREFVAVSTQLQINSDTIKKMDGKLDTALEYIAQQKGREMQNKAFYSVAGGFVASLVTYWLDKVGGGHGGG